METTLSPGSIDRFLTSLSAQGRSPNTVKSYGSDLRAMLASTGEIPLTQVEDAAAAWLTEHRTTLAPRTTCRRYTSIRAWARWAGLREILPDYSLPDPGKAEPHPLPEGDAGIEAMLRACRWDPVQRAVVVLCGKLGLRISEARSLTAGNIDTVERTVRVRGKGDTTRTVPVPEALWGDILAAIGAAMARGGGPLIPMSDRGVRQLITRLGHRAGLSRAVASHDLRATAATHIHDVTKDVRVVQEILGHKSLDTTQVYTEAGMRRMRDALEASNPQAASA